MRCAAHRSGAGFWYVLGRRWGAPGVRRFVDRHGGWLLLEMEDVDRATAWFERHQRSAIFAGRLVPGVRSLISVPAGITRTPVARFVALTAAGRTLWTIALTVAGYALADAYMRAREVIGPVGTIVWGGLLAWMVVRHVRRRRARRQSRRS